MTWDAEKEQFLIANYSKMLLKDIARSLGMDFKNLHYRCKLLRAKGVLSLSKRFYMPRWSESEKEYLNEMWGIISESAIARHLKRTIAACGLKAKGIHINKKMNIYTRSEVARIFGIDSKTVKRRLVDTGYLNCKRAGFYCGKKRAWNIDMESIEKFIMENIWFYDWRKMEPGYFRELAEKAWQAGPWLTIPEVSIEIGKSIEFIRRWLVKGSIPYKLRMKYRHGGNPKGIVIIRKSDIPAALAKIEEIVHMNRSNSAKARTNRQGGWGRYAKRQIAS